MNNFFQNILWWAGILLLQVFLIFYFKPTLVYTPYIYIFLLLRVNSLQRSTLLILAFFVGLLVDSFTNSWGVHTSSLLLVVFLQPMLNSLLSRKTLSENVDFSIASMGGLRYGVALFAFFFIYHLIIEFLWNFSLQQIPMQLLKVLICTLLATFIILFLQSIFTPNKQEDNG